MRKSLILLLGLFLAQLSLAQTLEIAQPRRWEFGIEGLQVSHMRSAGIFRYQIGVQPLTGVYVRHFKGRWGVRMGLGYSGLFAETDGSNCSDCGFIREHGAEGRIRTGLQFAIPKKRDWVYAIADLQFKHSIVSGTYENSAWGYIHSDYQARTSFLLLQIGAGLQANLFKHVYVGTEGLLGFGWMHEWKHDKRFWRSGQQMNTGAFVTNIDGFVWMLPLLRLHIGVRF